MVRRADQNQMFLAQDTKLTAQGMAAEERLNKTLYKCTLYLLKIIPMLIALCDVLNAGLSFIGIEAPVLSYLGGVSFLTLVFLYLTSYAFGFCMYHRLFLHYSTLVNIISTVDLYVGIPVSTKTLLEIHCIILGVFLFLILKFRKKC